MANYFAENSLLSFMVGLLAVASCITFAFLLKKWKLLGLAGFFFLITLGLVVYERIVKTDSEQIIDAIYKIAESVEHNDVQGSIAQLGKSNALTKKRIEREMPLYKFSSCRIASHEMPIIETNVNPPRATIRFKVSVVVDAPTYNYKGFAIRGVTLTYEKEPDGIWRIVDYSHYDPRDQFNNRDQPY